jgi:hypothetical protein
MCSVVPDPEVPPHSPASPEIPESYASPSVLEAIGGPLSRAEDLARHPLIGWEEGVTGEQQAHFRLQGFVE